jgi:hypothetical protein
MEILNFIEENLIEGNIEEWFSNIEPLSENEKEEVFKALDYIFGELQNFWKNPEVLRVQYPFLSLGHPNIEKELIKGVQVKFDYPYFPDYTSYDVVRRENYVNYLLLSGNKVFWTGDLAHYEFRYPIPPDNEEWDSEMHNSLCYIREEFPNARIIGFREVCSFSDFTPVWVGLTLLPQPQLVEEWLKPRQSWLEWACAEEEYGEEYEEYEEEYENY